MKTKTLKLLKIILCLLLFTPLLVQAQEIDNSFNKTPQEMHDMFMHKSKTKKTVAWITLGTGLTLFGTGLAISSGKEYGVGEIDVASVIVVVGTAAAIVSVPFFISAGSNKRKAILALKGETVSFGAFEKSNNLSLSFTIPF